MSRSVLLLMGTGTYRVAAFLESARGLDVDVVVGTEEAGAAVKLDPGRVLAVAFDEAASAVERVSAFAAGHPFSAVVASEDDGAELAAGVAQVLGLRGHPLEAVRRARGKAESRAAFRRAGFRTPGYRVFDAIAPVPACEVAFPCVLKPTRLAASRGVTRANNPEEFLAAWDRLCRLLEAEGKGGTEILVEDYIPGDEVAVEGLLTDGKLRVLAIFDKPDPLEGPYFEETIYVTPSRHPGALQRAVEDTAQKACTALGLTFGPVHAEFRLNEEGVWPLEVAPRSIGGLCSRALSFADGSVTLEELILRHALGEDVSGYERERQASGVMMIPIPRGGILRAVHGKREALAVEHIEDVVISIPLTQRVVPLPEGNRYLGFIFARATTPDAVEASLRAAHARLRFDIADE